MQETLITWCSEKAKPKKGLCLGCCRKGWKNSCLRTLCRERVRYSI